MPFDRSRSAAALLVGNRKGEQVGVSDVTLHVQCGWRFVDAERILFARDDLNYPADKTIAVEDLGWDRQESILDVTQRAWFRSIATPRRS